ncbi:MAG: YggS family pyridoxal phosphate-dependent enzyme [Gammaproteobacteria bacterium]|nr:YggS family pyridoxal phosphate-dependent enzyme [Gammaproteobacteria bacterium]MCY4282726.1 YggS family pyridoxal phosphate-dependent enzyme [Gammaproteobacteria bacterium]MCY4339235.1 YggS family pyridoxal phosphate-dependent enzyme [Gammaproteobacteria bacterium]
MNDLHERLQRVRREIAKAERQFGREAGSVKLLAVSKTRGADAVLALARLGVTDFGENYVQEAQGKLRQLPEQSLGWHFIGPAQSNKTGAIATCFDWVHSLARMRIATRLDAARPADLPPLNVCIQVNIDAEVSKSGVTLDALEPLAEQICSLPRLRLRGLMALPAPAADFAVQRRAFAQLRQAQERLSDRGFALDTLSMGTTNDMRAAIAEGATLVRIGTALFGPRK